MKKLLLVLLITLLLVSPALSKIWDAMETVDGWTLDNEEGCSSSFKAVPGKVKNAMEYSYDLGTGNWVQIYKSFNEDLSTIQGIQFNFKGEGSLNNLQLKLEDADNSCFGKTFEAATVTDDWAKVVVPISQLEYWWGGDKNLDKTKIAKLFFAISKKAGGKGKIYIDEIEFLSELPAEIGGIKGKMETIKKGAIDKMESESGWFAGGENQAKVKLASISGNKDKAVRLEYDFADGNWLQMEKIYNVNIKDNSAFIFDFQSKGDNNTFQFKAEDADGSVFGINMDGMIPTRKWQKVEIPFSKLVYFWGGNKELDLTQIKRIFFTVVKKDGGEGSITIDEFEVK